MVRFNEATALVGSIAFTAGTAAAAQPAVQCPGRSVEAGNWPGWDGVKHAFIFGDSYTQTGFDYKSTQPDAPSNPLGNPVYPGWTSSNGPNWVDFLTVKHNASALNTYNFGYGGATVDSDIVAPYAETVISMKSQVEDEFLPGYTGSNPTAGEPQPDWTGADSLFALWIGINDVGMSFWFDNATTAINDAIFAEYESLVTKLWSAGGRNFAFINVPTINRAPQYTSSGEWAIEHELADAKNFNQRLVDLAEGLKSKHGDEANVWVLDTFSIFDAVLDDPTIYEATSGIENTTDYCEAYSKGTDAPDTLIDSCKIPVNQYFWLNTLHPTYPIHDVVALELSELLKQGPNISA